MHHPSNRRPARRLRTAIASAVLVGTVLATGAALGADAEGDEGDTIEFTVTLSNAPRGGCVVKYDFKTEDDSAVAGDDYTAKNGTVTFSSGEKQKTVGVESLNDTVSEEDETFKLKLDNQTWLGLYHGNDVCYEEHVVGTGGFPTTMTLTGKIVDVAPTSGN